MSGLAWKLNRLRCMTPAEVVHRVVQAAAMRAERLGLMRCVVPAPDLCVPARPWVHADAHVDAAAYVAAADKVLAGRYDVFALEDIELGDPPEWNRDPKTGIEAPLAFGKQLDYRDPRVVGDIKYLWEPNRHLHLVTLAQAHALTGDERYSREIARQLDSWFEACPFRMGANWSSALEAGLRLLNWSLAWQLLGGVNSALFEGVEGAAFRRRWLTSVYQHAEFVCGHFSLHSSANNHLIGEASGVFAASMCWPFWHRASHWHGASREILEREALLQNGPDGVNREQATSYQQFTFDLLLLPWLAARANGRDFPEAYQKRLEGMLDFIASVMDAGGNMPMFGDADDAYAAKLDPRPSFCRFKSLLATGAVLFERGEFKAKAGRLDDKTRWLLGPSADARFEAVRALPRQLPVRREFPTGGYWVLGCDFEQPDEIRVVADAGPLGYREIAAHGHADALSFTLSIGGHEFLVDPGTFAYHTETAWRSYFRGTSAHNTVRVDHADQSKPGGNFMWLRKANAACTAWTSTPHSDCFEGWHDGYRALPDPVVHRRRIVLDKAARRITVRDTLAMRGQHEVELFFHCAEGAQVAPIEGGVSITLADRTIRLLWPDVPGAGGWVLEGSVDPIGGWVSRRFDHKAPAPTIVWRARLAGETTLLTQILCSENQGREH
ncbi:MAG TPA: alginate lyase family protein [Usitatibacter sp.]|nr:alginate lyase family protein [Usitatibacter sp.]